MHLSVGQWQELCRVCGVAGTASGMVQVGDLPSPASASAHGFFLKQCWADRSTAVQPHEVLHTQLQPRNT